MPRPANNARAELALLRGNIHELINSWRRRAAAANKGGMPQIAMDFEDCADELNNVVRDRPNA